MKLFNPIRICCILFIIGSLGVARGQMAAVAEPAAAGFSSDRLDRYGKFLEDRIKNHQIPGAVSLVYRNGKTAQYKTMGFSDIENQKPMSADGIFQIMSMTKPVISVALMMLYEEGHFLLTDPVSKYLPQFKDLKVARDVSQGLDGSADPVTSEITIHQLFTHTAGFTHGIGGTKLDNEIAKALYVDPQASIERRVNTLLGLPMIGQPGEQWHYSASPDVLSLLIEHFSGQTTAEFLQERIFKPLEMVDTGYNIPKDKQSRLVMVHHINEEGSLVKSEQQFPPEGNTVYGGTHGLFSTASDYLNFCRMLLNNGRFNGHQLLSPNSVELMTMDHVNGLYKAPGQGFGLGFGVTTDLSESKALGSVGQYYWSGAWCTYFFVDPQTQLIGIFLTQVQPYTNFYGDKMRQFIYQAITE